MRTLIITILLMTVQMIAEPCCCSRWDIKTINDSQSGLINFTPVNIEFAGLYMIDSLSFGNNKKFHTMARLKDEEQVYRLKCRLIKWTVEDDSDYHLIVSSLNNNDSTIVCEIPSNNCESNFQPQFSKCRNIIENCSGHREGRWHVIDNGTIITIEGIVFHDFKHTAKGTSPNCLELHPVLNIVIN